MRLRCLNSCLLLCLLSTAAFAQDTTIFPIVDPAYGIKAYTATVPAGWKFQGTVLPGPDCSRIPFPVFRAYSPDGLREIRLQPVFNWTFHPTFKNFRAVRGCINIGGPITAADFLQRYEEMIATNGMHVIGPMEVGSAYQAMVDKVADNMNHLNSSVHGTANAAAVRVETVNGSFIIEQRLRAYVACRVDTGGLDANGGGCSAHIDVERAPKGKLDALVALVDSRNLTRMPYESAWVDRVREHLAERAQQDDNNFRHMREVIDANQRAANAMLKKQSDDFMAASQRNHEAFMAQQESSFHSSMNNATASMNARSTAASDWVDYALDQQTVVGQGGYAKVSSAYTQTWSSTTGNQTTWYQSDDPNTNPNGVLPGNWTQDTKVHGNGQPY